jgi:hypothetical protein
VRLALVPKAVEVVEDEGDIDAPIKRLSGITLDSSACF